MTQPTKPSVIHEIGTWIGSALIGIIIALFISIFIFQPTKVIGNSMDPTLKNGQRIYVSKISHFSLYKPEYGDIVIIDSRVNKPRTWKDDIYDSPLVKLIVQGPDQYIWVKRVIGKPGDTIECIDGNVWRNGKKLDEVYIKEKMLFPFNKITIPKNCIWLMGDNRNYSRDCRDPQIGPLPIDHVLGRKITVPFIG